MKTLTSSSSGGKCRNPGLGLATKARACKITCQERKFGSEQKYEGMNHHIPKGASTLGVGVLVDSRMFKERLKRLKINGLRSSLYDWKVKMGSHDPFGHLKHKLWPNQRLGVKLPIWLPTTKSQESTQFPCVQVACNISLESSQWGL